MQRRQIDRNVTTATFETTQPVTWEPDLNFVRWDYKQTTFDVSGLKDRVNNAWEQDLTLPLGDNGTNTTVNWDGCIEERRTQRINDDDPSDNWDPIPAGALDMNVDLEPTPGNSDTQWGPMLNEAYYLRFKFDPARVDWFFTLDTISSSSNESINHYIGDTGQFITRLPTFCPSEAAVTKQWTAENFSNYLDGLEAIGNTYHDIGMLWGARLMSPTGIFSAINNDVPNIQRHMVFMTDGQTQSITNDVSAYGVNWFDRRQNDGTTGPSNVWFNSNINARTQALCKWVRNNNITLWVISYGEVGAATDDALKACVDNNDDRFFKATDTAQLTENFKAIADSISALRLTS